MPWRPSLPELSAHLVRPRSWGISLECLRKGIDNARVDCLVSQRFRGHAAGLIERLVREDFESLDSRVPDQTVSSDDLARFRTAYLALFESALERHPAATYREVLTLLHRRSMPGRHPHVTPARGSAWCGSPGRGMPSSGGC